jgi:hypothetical protein
MINEIIQIMKKIIKGTIKAVRLVELAEILPVVKNSGPKTEKNNKIIAKNVIIIINICSNNVGNANLGFSEIH